MSATTLYVTVVLVTSIVTGNTVVTYRAPPQYAQTLEQCEADRPKDIGTVMIDLARHGYDPREFKYLGACEEIAEKGSDL